MNRRRQDYWDRPTRQVDWDMVSPYHQRRRDIIRKVDALPPVRDKEPTADDGWEEWEDDFGDGKPTIQGV